MASTPSSSVPTTDQHALTVVVVDAAGKPTQGATVSIQPSDSSATTDAAGEAHFTLGSAAKYDVTASYGSNTVTVPYYVTKNGATRLVVNPVYVKTVQKALERGSGASPGLLADAGIGLGIAIVLVIIWRLFKRKR